MMIHENKHGNIVKLCLQCYSQEKRCFLVCGYDDLINLLSRNQGPDQQKQTLKTESNQDQWKLQSWSEMDRPGPTGQQKFANSDRTRTGVKFLQRSRTKQLGPNSVRSVHGTGGSWMSCQKSGDLRSRIWSIYRLNSGNFGIFGPDVFYSNLSSLFKSALKIIPNDTKIAYELQNFPIENRLFNFCVGETVIGKSPEVLRVFSKDSPLNLEHFHINLKGAANCGKKF